MRTLTPRETADRQIEWEGDEVRMFGVLVGQLARREVLELRIAVQRFIEEQRQIGHERRDQ